MLKNIKKWVGDNPKPVAIGCLGLVAIVAAFIFTELVSLPTTQSGTSITFRWEADEVLAINVTQIGSEPISGMVSFSSTSAVSYDAWRLGKIAPPIYGDPGGNLEKGVVFNVPPVNIPASTYLMRSGWADITLISESNITAALTPTGDLLSKKKEAVQALTLIAFLILGMVVILSPSPKKQKAQSQKSSLPPTAAPAVPSVRYLTHGRKSGRDTQVLDETSLFN
jgi:hypothetical protein